MNSTTDNMNNMNNMNNINIEKRGEISAFLENLIDQYKRRLLTEEQERRVTEFYMKECFLNSKDSSDSSNASDPSDVSNVLNVSNVLDSDASDNLSKDSLKYLVMGWYVYEQLIKKNNLWYHKNAWW